MDEISPLPASSGEQAAQQTPPLSRWRRVQMVLILGSLSAFGPLSIDMYLPSLPSLSRDLSASASAAQLTLSTCLLGLALGQIIAGPLSDTLGRRRPLLIGLVAYILASLLCAVTPSIYGLIALRLVQGTAGAAGIVIARAIVRDKYSGIAAARFFSTLMLVSGIAPIAAPLIGGLLLRFTSWRGVFIILAILVTLMFLAATFGLGESLPSEQRQSGELRATLIIFRRLLTDRLFVGYALSCGLSFAAMFSYISGSPFVIQDIYGLSPQAFSLIFGTNALGIGIMGQVSGRLVGRVSPRTLLTGALTTVAIGGTALLVVVIAHIGLIAILPALFVVVASQGMVLPNATALALADHPRTAGSASALLGTLQFAIGASVAPLVGIGGTATALPMALVIAVLGIAALTTFIILARRGSVARNAMADPDGVQ
ncbi:MAG TPA: Bcr/CflA family multidrug efflux MFS transporter [Ktedonobacteraceae bacterium]|nr:Bcr/CflA family multidrug efflux MFS transporter [Ktedonobacteraceae bacterium]